MYEKIRRTHSRSGSKNGLLGVVLAVCLIVTAVLVGMVWQACRYQLDYRKFVSDLSNSTAYAYKHNSLTITMDGQTYPAEQENIHRIYSRMINAGPGRPGKAPASAPEASLEYGDGSFAELWNVKVENSSTDREIGLFIRYVNQDGESYAYDSDRLELLVLPIERLDNLP